MDELRTGTTYPWAASTPGLSISWVLTPDGLRMRWTQGSVETVPAVIELAVVGNQAALAA